MSESINQRIRTAVLPLVPVCEPHFYGGERDTYCVFEVTEEPLGFADNEVVAWRAQVTLILALPLETNSIQLRRQLCAALVEADFTAPTVTDIGDGTEQLWQFLFQGELWEDEDDG